MEMPSVTIMHRLSVTIGYVVPLLILLHIYTSLSRWPFFWDEMIMHMLSGHHHYNGIVYQVCSSISFCVHFPFLSCPTHIHECSQYKRCAATIWRNLTEYHFIYIQTSSIGQSPHLDFHHCSITTFAGRAKRFSKWNISKDFVINP